MLRKNNIKLHFAIPRSSNSTCVIDAFFFFGQSASTTSPGGCGAAGAGRAWPIRGLVKGMFIRWFQYGDGSTPINNPICSMYGIFTNIYPINDPNVGKYTIHGAYGNGGLFIFVFFFSRKVLDFFGGSWFYAFLFLWFFAFLLFCFSASLLVLLLCQMKPQRNPKGTHLNV